jgi:hypothetical protein
MADEVYDGAIGIDLGKHFPLRCASLFEQILTDCRHDLLLRRQL